MSVDNLNLVKDQKLVYSAYKQLKASKRAEYEAALTDYIQSESAPKKDLVQEQDLIQKQALESHAKPVLFSHQQQSITPRQVKPDVIPDISTESDIDSKKPKTPKPK